MTEASPDRPNLANKVRFVTATTLFDGHDASINIFRRILQASGAEVIHLGHNRTGLDIVDTAVEEDAHAIAVTSYLGGHLEFYRYLRDLLVERDAGMGSSIRDDHTWTVKARLQRTFWPSKRSIGITARRV